MIYTTINYNEAGSQQPLNYKSVEIHFGKEEKKFFDTGNFVKDWWDRTKFIIQEIDNDSMFVHSSSVDHFIMDGAPYDSAYLHIVDEKVVLKYIDRSDPDYLFTQADIFEKGTEIFVAEGTQPTWEELKEICK